MGVTEGSRGWVCGRGEGKGEIQKCTNKGI